MNKIKLIAAIGASTLALTGAIATSATAQPYRHYERGYNDYGRSYGNVPQELTTSYVDSLEWKINHAFQIGAISPGEHRMLLREFNSIRGLAWEVQSGQASRWEYNRLATGVNRIQAAVERYANVNPGYRRYGYNRY
jgi:hypothetical protein